MRFVFLNVGGLAVGYEQLLARIPGKKQKPGLAGAVITELADLSSEDSGLITYDRKVAKIRAQRAKVANHKALPAQLKTTSGAAPHFYSTSG